MNGTLYGEFANFVRVFLGVTIAIFVFASCSVSSKLANEDFVVGNEADRMIPVNVVIDADDIPDDQLTNGGYEQRVGRQNVILSTLIAEHAFLAISTYPGRYPVTLYFRYGNSRNESVVKLANDLVSTATPFIVPSYTKENISLQVDVFINREKIRTFSYDDEIKYNYGRANFPVNVKKNISKNS